MHKHHILPKHSGGTDHPDNLIELTVEEHAEAHRKLWEEHGKWQDRIAWLTLSGQIGKEEAHRLAAKYANLGKKHSAEHKAKVAAKRVGMKGKHHTEETKQKLREARLKQKNPWPKGSKHTEETKQKVREERRNRKIQPWPKGSKHTEETKQKLSDLMVVIKNGS